MAVGVSGGIGTAVLYVVVEVFRQDHVIVVNIVEKYSVNCIQITSDGIGYYIFYSKLTCFAIICYEGLVHCLIFG
jgi:hypothetical protein